MRICLVGGIFGKPETYRRVVSVTPETVLADGLRDRGHEVITRGHHGPFEVNDFDVVHVHHLSWGAVAAAGSPGPARLVFTPHLQMVSRGRRVAMRYVTSRSDATIALSRNDLAWQLARFPRVAGRQRAIPNGIDPQRFPFSPPPPHEPDAPWRLLCVGQLIALKGLDILLAALALCAPRRRVVLELVYHVNSEEPALRAQAERLGLDVRFLGGRTPSDVAGRLRDCHLFVLPSRTEVLPSVVTEAVFTGRPVVATDVGAVPEQVGRFGAVVPPDAPAAFAAALERAMDSYEQLREAAPRASAAAVERYSIATMVDRHEQLYRELCSSERRRSPGSAAGDRFVGRLVPWLAQRFGRLAVPPTEDGH